MTIDLFLILSATYEYVAFPHWQENEDASKLRRFIKGGIEGYMHNLGYTYNEATYEWVEGKE